jgi:hypothetical protein
MTSSARDRQSVGYSYISVPGPDRPDARVSLGRTGIGILLTMCDMSITRMPEVHGHRTGTRRCGHVPAQPVFPHYLVLRAYCWLTAPIVRAPILPHSHSPYSCTCTAL